METTLNIGEAELELIGAVAVGPFETPVWSGFLDKLRALTGANFAVLNFRPPRRPYDESVNIVSGAPQGSIDAIVQSQIPRVEPPMLESLVEGCVYNFDELIALNPSRDMQIYTHVLLEAGASGLRHMRVQEPSGINTWITLVRTDGHDFAPPATDILRLISRFLRIALQNHVALERERYSASHTAQAVRGLFGWIALDAAGMILDQDDQGALVLSRSGVVNCASNGRFTAKPASLEREIYAALRAVTDDPTSRPQAITLNRDPWLDMLIVPARRKSISASNPPVAIAYLHGDSWKTTDRREQLAQLFHLSPGESRLALALCRGMTIAEAAEVFGLTVGTARNYCKSIFAKTGARGQPDLVRIVMRSVLAIAPQI